MSKVTVNINSYRGISTMVDGKQVGRLYAERSPRIGIHEGLGFEGREILCLAVGACFYNNLQRLAKKRGIFLQSLDVDVVAEWDNSSLIARYIVISPRIETNADQSDIRHLCDLTLQESKVASTIRIGAPVKIKVVRGVDNRQSMTNLKINNHKN